MNKARRFMALVLAIVLAFTMAPSVFAATNVAINSTNFPDKAFRSYIKENFDINGDGSLSESEIENATYINVNSKRISSLKGVEYLSYLNQLYCADNDLSTIDLSKNTKLAELYCMGNDLSSLDLSKNILLRNLECASNKISELDLSNNPYLMVLRCHENKLSALDLSKNTWLTILVCDSNDLTSLDISKNTQLDLLYCSKNKLSSLDVSMLTSLYGLLCDHNDLSELDLSNNSELTSLSCIGNPISELDISECPKLAKAYKDGEKQTGTDNTVTPGVKYNSYTFNGDEGYFSLTVGDGVDVLADPAVLGVKSLENGDTNKGIVVKASGESSWTTLTSDSTGKSYTDKTATVGGATYSYRVAGYINEDEGWSDYSESASIVRNPFKDVKDSASYFKALMWAYNKGIVAGTSTSAFSPGSNCTRGQFALMLWRMNNKPNTSGLSNPFTDVASSNGFYKGIVWCYNKGITAGTSATTFSPNNNITRWQMILMFWRMQNKPASSLTENPFTDVKTTASYYKAALWAYEKKITAVEQFKPNDLCTRWQLVLFLYRLNNLYHYI